MLNLLQEFSHITAPKNLDHDSDKYSAIFFEFEHNIIKAEITLNEIRDEEIVRLFRLMRRSPDGPSEGFLHDVIYQSAALILGLVPLSRKEFDAIFKHLEETARGWQMNSSSQNYIRYLNRDLYGEIYEIADS